MGEIRVPLTPISDDDLPDNVAGADNLKAGSITANKILAHSITANEIAAGTITANEIKAGTITANEIAAGAITADKISLTLNDIPDGNDSDPNKNYARVKKAVLTADGLVILDKTTSDTYGLIKKTGITAGQIKLSAAFYEADYQTVDSNEKAGAQRAYAGLDANGGAIKYVAPSGSLGAITTGLYMDSTHLGYYYADQSGNGTWKTYMDNQGNFYLGGTDGSLTWDATNNTLTIKGNIESSSISSSDITGSTFATANGTSNRNIYIMANSSFVPQIQFRQFQTMEYYIQYDTNGININNVIYASTTVTLNATTYAKYGIVLQDSGNNATAAMGDAGGQSILVGTHHTLMSTASGQLLQAGTKYISSTQSTNIQFPTAFSSTPTVVVTLEGNGVSRMIHINNITSSDFDVGFDQNTTGTIHWIAKGDI